MGTFAYFTPTKDSTPPFTSASNSELLLEPMNRPSGVVTLTTSSCSAAAAHRSATTATPSKYFTIVGYRRSARGPNPFVSFARARDRGAAARTPEEWSGRPASALSVFALPALSFSVLDRLMGGFGGHRGHRIQEASRSHRIAISSASIRSLGLCSSISFSGGGLHPSKPRRRPPLVSATQNNELCKLVNSLYS